MSITRHTVLSPETHLKSVLFFISLALLAHFPVEANDLQVIISGRAIHEGSNNQNENNYGLGLQYDVTTNPRWIPTINLASFKDSSDNTSRYIGAGLKRRFRFHSGKQRLNFDLGGAALVMKRPDYNDDRPFLGALPFVSLSNDWGGVNATYVPSLEEGMMAFWYFQFSFKLLEF